MSVVIKAEGLSKKYIIGHERQTPYGTLRDTLALGAQALGRRLFLRSAAQAQEPTQEEFWALRDVSFEIRQGERVGIIGRNGAGKSTLLKILSRITEPTQGRVEIHGRVASLLEVGTGFHPELTGRENIFLNGAVLGMSRVEIKAKFDEIVAFAEVEQFLDTPVKRYSSGMYVRLAFAVAAHLEPEILIVDEVLAVGDAEFQKRCIGKMTEVAADGRTILFVSHNMESVQRLCDRCLLLAHGKVSHAGSVDDVISHYLQGARSVNGGSFERRPEHTKQTACSSTIASLKLRNREGDETVGFDVWDYLELEMILQHPVRRLANCERLSAWICFNNVMGASVLSYFQHDSGGVFCVNGKYPTTITAKIPVLDLPPGAYTISCGLFLFDEFNKREIIDWVENLGLFEIRSKLSDGRVFDGRIGQVISRCDWGVATT